MSQVYIGFDDYGIKGVDNEFIYLIFSIVTDMAELPVETEVGLVLATDDKMRRLNKQYRNKNQTTNVLSFSCQETSQDNFITKDDKNYLGDIYICRTELERGATKLGVSHRQEFMRLFVHGLLHLAGVHHDSEAKAKLPRSGVKS